MPPIFRSVEENWLEAQGSVMDELQWLGFEHKCPLFIAGDITHKPNSSPELINFICSRMPKCYAIPGNHDLPLHNYEDIKKSAYWTLVEAGVLKNLPPGKPFGVGELVIQSFPFGTHVEPFTGKHNGLVKTLALIHHYIWTKTTGFHNAPKDLRLKAYKKKLKGYDFAAFGDNHNGFVIDKVINCGSIMRRHSDQIDYRPFVGLLLRSGKIIKHHMDISKDKITTDYKKQIKSIMEDLDPTRFFEELSELGEAGVDFIETLAQWIVANKISKRIKRAILKAVEKRK